MAKEEPKDATNPEKAGPPPNVIYRGEAEPDTQLHGLTVNGRATTITLPSADAQRAGFFHEYAGVLVESRPGYKWFNPDEAGRFDRLAVVDSSGREADPPPASPTASETPTTEE